MAIDNLTLLEDITEDFSDEDFDGELTREDEQSDKHTFSAGKNNIEELFSNLTENPVGMERKDFLSTLDTLYRIFDEEFEDFYIAPVTVLRNTEFYLYTDKGKPFAFVYPVTNFDFWLKSKGSLYRFSKTVKEITVNGQKSEEIGYAVPLEILWEYFSGFGYVDECENATSSFKIMNNLTQFILKSVQKLYFIPKVILADSSFTVKYELFSFDDELAEIFVNLAKADYASFSSIPDTYNFLTEHYLNFIIFNFLKLKASKFKDFKASSYFIKQVQHKRYTGSYDAGKAIEEWVDEIYIGKYPIRPILNISEINHDTFELTVLIKDYTNRDSEPVNASKLFEETDTIFGKPYEYVAAVCQKQLNYAIKMYPELETLFYEENNFKLILNVNEVYSLMVKTAYYLNKAGISVIFPEDFGNIVVPRASLNATVKENKIKDLEEFINIKDTKTDTGNIFDFDYRVALGDEKISLEEFEQLVKGKSGLIAYKNMFILAEDEDVKKILSLKEQNPLKGLSKPELLHAAFSKTLKDCEFDYDEIFANLIRDLTKPEDITLPTNLNGKLRPYQETGYKWLYTNITKGFGACIADDMGLGKTIQVISLILKLKEENRLKSPVLVVCPTTLLGNWVKELQTFAPSLKTSVYHGTDRVCDKTSDVVVTTFSILRIDSEKLKKEFTPSMFIVDEAQNIKNPDTTQTITVKSVKSDMKIAMTGTPVENRLMELWSIFDFLNKGYLGTSHEFQKRYAIPIEKFKQTAGAEKLKLSISPFVLRRLKTDKNVITDLPEKIVMDEYCYLSKSQAALYEKTLKDCMSQITGTSGINRRGMIFKLITALKQICNHPYQFRHSGDMTREASGKCDKFLSILDGIMQSGEKTVVFTQYKEMGKILVPLIKRELNTEALFFHGSLNVKQRDEMLKEFSNNPERKVMILSLKAGGTGLNLTNATNVIHYDLWWNPAVEDQATDRIYRIGQKFNVMVHRLITLGTFEEKIDEMIKKKKELVELAVYKGEKNITELTDEEIYKIFTLSN